jgi:chromate transporter
MNDEAAASPADRSTGQRVRLISLLGLFLRLGAANFGGGNRAWVHREVVERRKWLDEPEFMSGFTISTLLPGSNPVNLALYVGQRLCGGVGAACAVVGMIAPAFALLLISGYLYRHFGTLDSVHFVLGGITAAAAGASLSVSVKMARRMPMNVVAVVLALTAFIAVGVLHWPLIPVLLALMPVSVGWAYFEERRGPRDH